MRRSRRTGIFLVSRMDTGALCEEVDQQKVVKGGKVGGVLGFFQGGSGNLFFWSMWRLREYCGGREVSRRKESDARRIHLARPAGCCLVLRLWGV